MSKSPLAAVKERFKSKEALVTAVQKLLTDPLAIDRLDTDKGLDSVSNRKLLHLHDVLERVKKDFGSRAKLIEAIVKDRGHAKDAPFTARLERYPTPRLLSLYLSGQRRKRSAAKPS